MNCVHMEKLCRKRAAAYPEQVWIWLARAERWKSLGHRNTDPNVRHNAIEGDRKRRSLAVQHGLATDKDRTLRPRP